MIRGHRQIGYVSNRPDFNIAIVWTNGYAVGNRVSQSIEQVFFVFVGRAAWKFSVYKRRAEPFEEIDPPANAVAPIRLPASKLFKKSLVP